MSVFHLLNPFDPEKENWESYMTRFRYFLEANDLISLSDNRKRALFLSHCGHEVFDMSEFLSELMPVQLVLQNMLHNYYTPVLQNMLQNHYTPVPSKVVRQHEFCQKLQKEGESINQYLAALRKAATQCKFRDLDVPFFSSFPGSLKAVIMF